MRSLFLVVACLFLSANVAQAQVFIFEIAFPNLTFNEPTVIKHASDGEDRLYVAEQPGRIMTFPNDPEATASSIFLNITARVNSAGWEEGLLGLAFHPEYAENGYFYVNYTASSPRRTVISRFSRDEDNPLIADPDSELIILEINQPFSNHNGGDILFGPDGYLYIAMGDGGSGGDPQNHGQTVTSLLGKILRIDVDENGTPPDCGPSAAPYTIPDNALADGPGGTCDEIYSLGMRNPWRFSFDHETGWFWVADVGQNAWEEINIVNNGDNMGWKVKEGFVCYSSLPQNPPCDDPSLVDPIWVYGFAGGQSITGGYVSREERNPALNGKYVYSDYISRHIWALDYDGVSVPTNVELFRPAFSVAAFGVDMHQNLYFASHISSGRLYRIKQDGVDNEVNPDNAGVSLSLAGPNPFRTNTQVQFTVDHAADVQVLLFDVLGRQVATLYEGAVPAAGMREVAIQASGLASGTYLVTLQIDGARVATQRLTVMR